MLGWFGIRWVVDSVPAELIEWVCDFHATVGVWGLEGLGEAPGDWFTIFGTASHRKPVDR